MVKRCVVVGVLVAAAGIGYYGWRASKFDLALVKEIPERTLVYDRNGLLWAMSPDTGKPGLGPGLAGLGTFHQGPPRAGGQPLLRPPRSRSDRGTAGDRDECEIGRKAQGASTITMQLARNTYGMREMSLQRKIMEAALAIRLEREYSKEEILTYYMNRVYFGSGLYGVERAAQGYFMKSASELTLARVRCSPG